jgi:hypothetical protein
MAIELQVSAVTALLTSEPREKQAYESRGRSCYVRAGQIHGEYGVPLVDSES